VKTDITEYSGVYEASVSGDSLDIRVGKDGALQVIGHERTAGLNPRRRFTLTNARLDHALLLGTRVYDDGSSEPFEGLFINRTEFSSPSDKGTSHFGIGVLEEPEKSGGPVSRNAIFYQKGGGGPGSAAPRRGYTHPSA
jgi:hypothetical protein